MLTLMASWGFVFINESGLKRSKFYHYEEKRRSNSYVLALKKNKDCHTSFAMTPFYTTLINYKRFIC